MREEIRAASDRPDKAWEWLREVYDKDIKPAEKMMKLQDPGDFGTLDTKLLAALTRSAKGDLGQRILNYKEEQAMKGNLIRGRQVLVPHMFDEYFRTSEEAGNLYQLEDLLNVARRGDTIEDLKRFINVWDRVLAGMNPVPEEASLRDIFMRQVRECPLIKLDIELYDRATKTDVMKQGDGQTDTIYNCCRNLLDRERLRINRERIAEKGNPKGGQKDSDASYAAAIAAAVAKGKSKGKSKSKSPGRSKKFNRTLASYNRRKWSACFSGFS